MDKCELCGADSLYEYLEKQLCSACVTKLAQQDTRYFADRHDGADHKVIIQGETVSIVTHRPE